MSRVYFHTRDAAAELRGSERAWLAYLARSQSNAAWDLEFPASQDRVQQLLAWVSPHQRNYLHVDLKAWRATNDSFVPGAGREAMYRWRRLLDSTRTYLNVQNFELYVAGHLLHTVDVGFNAALVAGSRPVQLATKLHAYCEVHAWVEGPHRAWLADVIDEGLVSGLYRRQLTYAATSSSPAETVDQGWDDVVTLLRSADDEPVVTSYSVTEWFPNATAARWRPPPLDPDWRPDWAHDHDGDTEWVDLSGDDRELHRDERRLELWHDLGDDVRWELAVAGLREHSPWLELSPTSLGDSFFGPRVTPYDLWAVDAEDRVRRACEDDVNDEHGRRLR